MADPDEAVLQRATELYMEGMALEEAGDTHRALDRYKRAVRMGNEKKIVERIRAAEYSGAAAASLPAPTREEDFQLWQAMHMSRLEAEVDAEARGTGPAAVSSSPPARAAAAPKAAFNPPARAVAPAAPQREDHDVDQEELEVADRITRRHIPMNLGASSGARRDLKKGVPSADDALILPVILTEIQLDLLAFLDPVGLDKSACCSEAMRQMCRDGSCWQNLARMRMPVEECDRRYADPELNMGRKWRSFFLMSARLRTDGIYIAPCGYPRRIQRGASVTDNRESMYVRYFRLIRVLPDEPFAERRQRVLIVTFEGEAAVAVEALRTHAVGREVTFGSSPKAPSQASTAAARKLQDKVLQGTYELDPETMRVTMQYESDRSEYKMEFKLAHVGKHGARQNCRLIWSEYTFTSLRVPEDAGSFDLQRDQHYAPYAFTRMRSLEHLF